MPAVEQRGSWLKLSGYAALALANVFLLVAELVRDDPRWWKLGISVALILVGGIGAAGEAQLIRSRPNRVDA